MFGFLKDKLKKAVQAFSKSAESEVQEEKVEDKQQIEAAKQAEEKILKKAAPAKKAAPVKAAPAKSAPAKPEPKAPAKVETKKPAPKEERPEPKKAEPKATAKPEQKPIPKPEAKKPEIKTVQKEEHPAHKEIKTEAKASEKKPAQEQEIKAKERAVAAAVVEQKAETVTESKNRGEDVAGFRKPEVSAKQGFFGRLFGKKKEEKASGPETQKVEEAPAAVAPVLEQIEEEIEEIEEDLREDEAVEEHAVVTAAEPVSDTIEKEEPSQGGFLGRLKDAFTKKTLTPEKFDELFWELELAMLENNVAVEVIEKIKSDLRDELTSGKVSRMGIEDMITQRLKQSVEELFDVETFDLVERIKQSPKPFKICMIGVNGSGKTTTLAKIIHLLQKNEMSVVVAASDTFRAAAIDQLGEHTERLGVKLISQGYGADPAAVAFDAIKHAESKGADVVLIDTAGRLHSNTNLMAELEKVVRVAKPDMKIFIGESITGNDCVEQAQVFNKLVGIDAIILSKADIDEKGGAAISVSYVTGKPILYLGTGQTYDDLEPFDKQKIISSLELE